MQSEIDTPIDQRFLCLGGFVSPNTIAQVATGLPKENPKDSEVFFVKFAYADLPIGKEFQVAFLKSRPEKFVNCMSKIVAVSQRLGKPFSEVPHGWKTICCIQFLEEIPELLRQLPVLDAWCYSENAVCLSSLETWKSISAKALK